MHGKRKKKQGKQTLSFSSLLTATAKKPTPIPSVMKASSCRLQTMRSYTLSIIFSS